MWSRDDGREAAPGMRESARDVQPAGDVLITGATGFVGMEVLARYLEHSRRRIIALVRADDDAAATGRINGVLDNLFGERAGEHRPRVTAHAANLTAPGLGLRPDVREGLACQVSTIVHSAASVSFTLPLDDARAINVEGTRRMLEFAEEARACGGLERYGHVSTAYVAGDHAGRFAEADLDVGQGFRNTYERSKFEAEGLVRSQPGLPFTIMRPSIVVGDRRSGWTAAFNVLYWPLRAVARGLFTAVPAVPSAPVDVVSVDYVADAVHELCEGEGGIGQTYHLTAGQNVSTFGEIAQAASRYFRRPLPRVLSPAEFDSWQGGAVERAALEAGRAYFPYFSVGTVFDQAAALARLEPRGICSSPLNDYLERLLDFATRSRWGKRPIARADALAA
jgi:thioester reductase-like protein